MAKDARQLREDAAEAAAAGKHKRALESYLELERLEPADAQWPKRAAETYRRLGKMRDAVAAFERAADRYAQNGFLVQAIAVCKLILQIDPSHIDTQQRLAAINAAQGAGPTRISSLSENHPSLHENPAVALLRGGRGEAASSGPAARAKPPSAPPVVSFVDSANRSSSGSSGGIAGSSGSFGSASNSGSFGSASSSGAIHLDDPGDDPYGLGAGYDDPSFGAAPGPRGAGGYGGAAPSGPGQGEDFFASRGGGPPGAHGAQTGGYGGGPSGQGGYGGGGPSGQGGYGGGGPSGQGGYGGGPSGPRGEGGYPAPRTHGPSYGQGYSHGGPSGQSTSQPIMIQRGLALESVPLGSMVAGAHQQRDDGSQPGIVIIPIDPLEDSAAIDVVIDEESARAAYPHAGPPSGPHSNPAIELDLADVEAQELEPIEDDGEIPLAAPRLVGAAARQALAATPLFAALNERQLESLIGRIDLMTLAPGQVLFHEGEHGDSLLVIAEGEVVVQAEGPPRVDQSVLSAGAFFGEVTLITDHPRMATVTARTMVEVLRIDRDALAFVLARHPEVVTALLRFVRDRLVERWMRTSPLCKPFAERQRREFASRFRFLEIESGSVVMAPGDEADGLYIVLAGQFVVRRGGEDAAILGPGELIGETVLMTGEPLQSSVIANTKCLALWLPVDHFREVIMIHPHVLEYVGAQAERRRVQIY